MKLLDKLIKGSISDLIGNLGDAVDKVVTNEEERLKAKNELAKIVTDKLTDIASFQKEVLVTELTGTKLQRSWRPIIMLTFGFIVAYAKFIAPAFNLPNATLETDFWNLLQLGMGGYVVGRSVEKTVDILTKNTDLTFIKKKNRTLKD